MATVTQEIERKIESSFQRIFKTIENHIPERNTKKLTLYPINKPVQQQIARPQTTQDETTAGPRRITIEEYKQRQERRKQPIEERRSTRGGARARLSREVGKFKQLVVIASSPEEKRKYLQLLDRAKKNLNKAKKKGLNAGRKQS